jgi:hypothetical protein
MKRVVITAVMLLLITLSYTQEKFVGQWFVNGDSVETVIVYDADTKVVRVIAFDLVRNTVIEERVNMQSATEIRTTLYNKKNGFKAGICYELIAGDRDKLKVTMIYEGNTQVDEYFR